MSEDKHHFLSDSQVSRLVEKLPLSPIARWLIGGLGGLVFIALTAWMSMIYSTQADMLTELRSMGTALASMTSTMLADKENIERLAMRQLETDKRMHDLERIVWSGIEGIEGGP